MPRRLLALLGRSRSLLRSGSTRLIGFGLSVIISAAASLAAIPAMIAASGEAAWGSIALGQAIGLVGGVAVGYGWGWFGPARIAQCSVAERRVEYFESLIARGVLVLPVAAVAAVVANLLAPSAPLFASVSAAASTSMGLTAAWYFVGLARPFVMLALDTLPRAGSTAVAIYLMHTGHSAVLGPVGTFFGSVAALALSTIWVIRETDRDGAQYRKPLSARTLLARNKYGVASGLAATVYSSAPLAIVSVVAPSIQPAFALVDRIRLLVVVAAAPAVTVLQGWVPRAFGVARVRRANIALLSALMFAAVLGMITRVGAPILVNWFGNGRISVSWEVYLFLSCCVAVTLFQSVLEKVALATFDELRAAIKSLATGSIVGLPLVGVGASQFGVAGALGGVLIGLLVVVAFELIAYAKVTCSGLPGRRD